MPSAGEGAAQQTGTSAKSHFVLGRAAGAQRRQLRRHGIYSRDDLLIGYRFQMPDSLSKSERSERMSRVRDRDTKPELQVRSLVHRMGFRFRLHDRRLPGAPDLVFAARRKVIFVHGCFWHRHPDPDCNLARMPKSRLDFWGPKLEGNRQRDFRNQSQLDAIGCKHLVVWECELRHREQLENKLFAFLTEGDAK